MKTCKRCGAESSEVQTYEATFWNDDNDIYATRLILCPECFNELWESIAPYGEERRIM